jgi:hypothetical protein
MSQVAHDLGQLNCSFVPMCSSHFRCPSPDRFAKYRHLSINLHWRWKIGACQLACQLTILKKSQPAPRRWKFLLASTFSSLQISKMKTSSFLAYFQGPGRLASSGHLGGTMTVWVLVVLNPHGYGSPLPEHSPRECQDACPGSNSQSKGSNKGQLRSAARQHRPGTPTPSCPSQTAGREMEKYSCTSEGYEQVVSAVATRSQRHSTSSAPTNTICWRLPTPIQLTRRRLI